MTFLSQKRQPPRKITWNLSAVMPRRKQAKEGTIQHKLWLAREYGFLPSLDQHELAERIKVSRTLISRYETDETRTVPLAHVERISKEVGWPVHFFYDGKPGLPAGATPPFASSAGIGEPPPAPGNEAHLVPQQAVGRRKFPIVGTAGASSFPLESDDPWPGDYVPFDDDLFRPERYAIQLRGNSMAPRFRHGDYLLVQPSQYVESRIIAIAKTAEHEYTAKVMRRFRDGDGEKLELHPIAPDFSILYPEEGWEIVGYAVGWRREIGNGRYIEQGDNSGLTEELP